MKLKWSNMVFKKWEEIRKGSSFLWVGRKKVKRLFRRFCFYAFRGCRSKLERIDFTGGPAKRVRTGRIGVKVCATSVGRKYRKTNLMT